jgi:hypothetical protein
VNRLPFVRPDELNVGTWSEMMALPDKYFMRPGDRALKSHFLEAGESWWDRWAEMSQAGMMR